MTTNEASRVTDAMVEAAWVEFHRSHKGLGRETDLHRARRCLEAALASRLVDTSPVAPNIDPVHGDKREVIINALCASSNWMRGYAEAFVDDFVDGKAGYVAVAELEVILSHASNAIDYMACIDVIKASKLRNLINQAGEK